MANVTVYNMEGNEVGTMELNDAVFGVEINEHLVHLAVVRQLANKRQGTQKAKTRSEVSGGGRKPWRQKGTGHARQGSIRAPQWTGGGVVFAPVPRDYEVKMNKVSGGGRKPWRQKGTGHARQGSIRAPQWTGGGVVFAPVPRDYEVKMNKKERRKPWRQKGTGHARQGSIRAPQWTGGGVVFAPVPRDYEVKMNKKERRAALKSALTSKVQDNKLVVVDSLALAEVKTKEMQRVLTNLKAEKALVITAADDKNVVLSTRNIADVQTATVNTMNVYDVMKHNTVVVTKDAVASIEEVYA